MSAWHLVRSWLDVRTQSKIEFLSAGAQTSARLKELIPLNVLPSEYGGSGSSWFCKKDHTEVCRFPHHMYSSKQDISRFIDVAPGEKLRVDTYVAEPMTLQIRVTARDVVAGDKDIKDEGKVQHTSLAASFLGFHRTKNAGKASEEETPAETVITETTVTKVAPQHHSFHHHHHQQQHQQHHHESHSNDASSIQHSSGSSVNEGNGVSHSLDDVSKLSLSEAHHQDSSVPDDRPERKLLELSNDTKSTRRFKICWSSTSAKSFVHSLTIVK